MRTFLRFLGEIWKLALILPAFDLLRWIGLCIRNAREVLRSQSLAAVDREFGTRVRFRAGGRWLEIHNGAMGVVREIVGSKCYCYPSELTGARQILDLGANCGAFTLFALASAPSAIVTSVEIQPALAEAARGNVTRNGFSSRVRIENQCVGGLNDAIVGVFRERTPPENFDCDSYIAEVGSCDFLKCDIEGSEFGLFTEGSNWLRGVRKAAIEYHGDWESGRKLGKVLEHHGFSVVQKPHGSLGYLLASRS